MAHVRRPAVAGTWYPGTASELARAIDGHLSRAGTVDSGFGELIALIVPHAGLMYSGPVAAHAYACLRGRPFDVIVLAGPSHYVAFDGVSIQPAGAWETPLGLAAIDDVCAAAIMASTPGARDLPAAHAREHSLEMQLPFIQRLMPGVPIVPIVMGHQTRDAARQLGDGLSAALQGRRALLVASTDLSHYHEAGAAARLDGIVLDHVARFDADGLQNAFERTPEHACGGGPAIAVMRAARALGARDAAVLKYADSGDVSGDKSAVVGYMAAAIGTLHHGGR